MPHDFSPGRDETPDDGPPRHAPRHRLSLHLSLLPLLLALFAGQLAASAWSANHDLIYDEASHLSIARSLLEGRGYGFVGAPANDAFRPPLVPALYALLFAATGPSVTAARLLSALFAIAAALLLGLLARKLWGPASFLPAALLFATAPLVWFFATKAMVETALLFLTSAFLYALFQAREQQRWLLLCVPLLAVLFLTKYTAILFVPCFAIWTLWRQRAWLRSRWLLAGIGIAALILLPWLWNNTIIYGNPVGAAATHLASSSGFATHLDAYYLAYGIPVVLAAFLPLALYGLFRLKGHPLLPVALLILLLFLAALSLLEVKRERYLLPALPALALAAAYGSVELRQRFPRRAATALLAVLVLINLVLVPYGLVNYPKAERFVALRSAGLALAERCTSDAIYTNVYPYVFWYAHKASKPIEQFAGSGCVLLDGTVASYPAIEPLLAQRPLVFKQGDIRVYA